MRLVIAAVGSKVHLERSPFAQFTVYVDKPAVPFHDAIYRCQPQPSSPAHLLGRKKGFKDALDRCGVHPLPGVGNREQDIAPWPAVGMMAAVFLPDFDILRFNEELSAARHCIPRVQAEIHDHLLHLRGIRQRDSQILRRQNPDLDIVADDPPEEIHFFLDENVQVHLSGLQELFSPKREEL